PEPTDFARDYVSVRAQARADVEAGNDYAVTLGAPAVELLDAPYYAHPPTALLALLPLAPLGFHAAARAWLCVSLLALGGLAFMLSGVVAPGRSPGVALATFALLALWPPVLHDLAKGQWSILLAALIAAGWRALDQGRARAAGLWLGLAAALKVTPLLLLAYLWLRRRRAAWAMMSTIAALAALSIARFGLAPWRAWVTQARPNVLAWQTWIPNTASIDGAVARLFTTSAFCRPLLDAPALAQALTLALAALILGATAAATRVAAPPPRDDRRLFAAWTTLVVLLNPLGWTHTVIVALVALALLVEDAPPTAIAAVLAVLTVPRETLAVLAGPLPVSPGRGLALSVHAAALLAMLGVSLLRPKRGNADASPSAAIGSPP
ncbi:MAG TPA: glycosyltransferase family 87 protein, partial [Polyangia bacterium]|nr:glycosyltransferase family 87 protein [Polyangia bacterium]